MWLVPNLGFRREPLLCGGSLQSLSTLVHNYFHFMIKTTWPSEWTVFLRLCLEKEGGQLRKYSASLIVTSSLTSVCCIDTAIFYFSCNIERMAFVLQYEFFMQEAKLGLSTSVDLMMLALL